MKIMKNQVYASKMDGNWKKNMKNKKAISQFIQTLRVPGHSSTTIFDEKLSFWMKIVKIMKSQVYASKMNGNCKKNVIKKRFRNDFV